MIHTEGQSNALIVFLLYLTNGTQCYVDAVASNIIWPMSETEIDYARERMQVIADTPNVIIVNIIRLADNPEPKPEGK